MYAKLENNDLIQAPYFLIVDNMKVWNASAEEHIKQGWYPVTFTEPPTTDESHYAESYFELEGDEIVEKWVIKEAEPSADELLNIIMGEE